MRESYAMTPERTFSLLQAMAGIHNCTDKLKSVKPIATEKKDEAVAERIEKMTRGEFFFLKKAVFQKVLFWNTAKTVLLPARWSTTVKSNTMSKSCI